MERLKEFFYDLAVGYTPKNRRLRRDVIELEKQLKSLDSELVEKKLEASKTELEASKEELNLEKTKYNLVTKQNQILQKTLRNYMNYITSLLKRSWN